MYELHVLIFYNLTLNIVVTDSLAMLIVLRETKKHIDTVNSYESTKYTSVQFYLHMLYISFISAKMLAVINISYLVDHPIR